MKKFATKFTLILAIMMIVTVVPVETLASCSVSTTYVETIDDGSVFNIVAANTAYALDVKSQSTKDKGEIHLWSRGSQASQQFVFYKVNNEYYKIMNVNSGKFLDVSGNKNKNSTPIIQYSYHGGDNQLFRLIDAGDGFYYIQSKLGRYLDCRNGKFENGVRLQIFQGNRTDAQRFYLDPVVKNTTEAFCYAGFRPNAFEVIADNVPVKASRDANSETLFTLDKNAVIFVNESCVNKSNTHWYTVTVDGVVCYIFGGYLKEYKEDTVKVAKSVLDRISDILVVASFVPALDTASNIISVPIDALRGDYTGALLSAVACIPVVGEFGDAAKVARKVDKINDASKAAKVMSAKGTKLLNKAKNQSLKNSIKQLYRPGATIGDGGTADAIRHFLKTGELVGGSDHIKKGHECISNLTNIINKQDLDESDLRIANELLEDLKLALEGK